jgi:hypothetical protein
MINTIMLGLLVTLLIVLYVAFVAFAHFGDDLTIGDLIRRCLILPVGVATMFGAVYVIGWIAEFVLQYVR